MKSKFHSTVLCLWFCFYCLFFFNFLDCQNNEVKKANLSDFIVSVFYLWILLFIVPVQHEHREAEIACNINQKTLSNIQHSNCFKNSLKEMTALKMKKVNVQWLKKKTYWRSLSKQTQVKQWQIAKELNFGH